jgi:hypothetical protein
MLDKSYCQHHPPCPSVTPHWQCGRRTQVEQDMQAGKITEAAGRRLLSLWGVPVTPRKAFKGDVKNAPGLW